MKMSDDGDPLLNENDHDHHHRCIPPGHVHMILPQHKHQNHIDNHTNKGNHGHQLSVQHLRRLLRQI